MPPSSKEFPLVTPHAKRARSAENGARSASPAVFNHTGPLRSSAETLASGTTVKDTQFRDPPQPSAELPAGKNRGRHEISATAESDAIRGNPVAVAAAYAGRTSTALSLLKKPDGNIAAHTGMFVDMSTEGQPEAHQRFHAFPAKLNKTKDAYAASAMTIQTALDGLAKPLDIRTAPQLTGKRWIGGTGAIEAPAPNRGKDDGYDTDTERGKLARRVGVGREHLKDSLREIRKQSAAAKTATRSPSPPKVRGGTADRTAADDASREPFAFPDLSGKTQKEATYELTRFAFAGYQTIK